MNKQTETDLYREHFGGCQMGVGLGGWVNKVQGLRSTNLLLQNSHVAVKYRTGNRVNNIVITMSGVRWVQDLSG